jgi:Fe-S-cluster containining protein
MTSSGTPPWYHQGLAFECTRCGNCCTGEPGTVRISTDEVEQLAAHLDLSPEAFRERYTEGLVDGGLSLTEKPAEDGSGKLDCVFWDRAQGCTVYAHRPRQCRTWPFWRRNVASEAHWFAAAQGCPGMNRGPRHDADEITATALTDGTSGAVPGLHELD